MSERFENALVQATRWHAGQDRKKTGRHIPYVTHLLATASLVLDDGGTEDEAIAGLFHDAVEDQGVTPEDLEAAWGPEVARIVVACSDAAGAPGRPKPPWLERKVHHLASLEGAYEAVLRVTAADKLHNCRDIVADVRVEGPARLTLFRGGVRGTCWYYAAMTDVLERGLPDSRLTPDLRRETEILHELAGVMFPAERPAR